MHLQIFVFPIFWKTDLDNDCWYDKVNIWTESHRLLFCSQQEYEGRWTLSFSCCDEFRYINPLRMWGTNTSTKIYVGLEVSVPELLVATHSSEIEGPLTSTPVTVTVL